MINKLLVFFLISMVNISYAQIFKMKQSGVFSTLRYFKYVNKTVDVKKELSKLTVHNLKASIDQQEFSFRIAHNKLDPNKPTVIAHIGLDGQIDNANVLYLAKTAAKHIESVNFVVIDTLSSKHMSKTNCFLTLGGIEDIVLVQKSMYHLLKQTALKESVDPKFILMGGSGSSFTLYHAARFLNNSFNDEEIVKGIFILSGFDSYDKYLKYLDTVERYGVLKHSDIGRTQYKKLSRKSRFTGKLLIKNQHKFLKRDLKTACPDMVADDSSYIGLLESSFSKIQNGLEHIYRTAYPKRKFLGFNSLFDYHEKIKISDHLNELKIPLLLFHSKNDPMSLYGEMEKVLFQPAKTYSLVEIQVSQYGGHASFAWVYGEQWLFGHVNSFLKSLSPLE